VTQQHAPSLGRVPGARRLSLPVTGVLAAVVALGLAGCASSTPQSQPLTVQPQATEESPTGPAAASDSAADAPSPTDSSAADPNAQDPNALDSGTSPTAQAVRPAARAKSVKHVVVTKTVRAGAPATSGSGAATAAVDVKTVVAAESTALKAASSVHVVGTVTVAGEKFEVDMNVGADGDGVLNSPDGRIQVRRVGADLFLAVDDAFFTINKHPELAAAYQGKWMPIDPGDPAYANILPITQLATWTKLMAGAPVTAAAKGTAVGGTPTTALTGGTGAKSTTVLVAASGPALPLVARSGDKVDELTFTGWGSALPAVTAPTELKDEPDDTLVDVPSFAEESTKAFAKLWLA